MLNSNELDGGKITNKIVQKPDQYAFFVITFEAINQLK